MSDSGTIIGICISRPDRLGLLCRSIRSFNAQTYLNKKLLIIINDENYEREIVTRNDMSNAALLMVHQPVSLHDMVIVGLRAALDCGKYVMFWDDDDVSHPDRLVRQISGCMPLSPCYLSGAMYHYFDSNELFTIDYEERYRDMWTRIVETSMVAYADDLRALDLPRALRRKTQPAAAIGRSLMDKQKHLYNCPYEWWWMKVGIRGDNLQGYENLRRKTGNTAQCVSSLTLLRRLSFIETNLDRYIWDGPVDVCGHDGRAFVYNPTQQHYPQIPAIGDNSEVEQVVENL
jgi:glycosyltransferase involved in cell wall biosynthesis